MITDEIRPFVRQALKVDFLAEHWEKELYAGALMAADAWGKKVDEENEKYRKQHRSVLDK